MRLENVSRIDLGKEGKETDEKKKEIAELAKLDVDDSAKGKNIFEGILNCGVLTETANEIRNLLMGYLEEGKEVFDKFDEQNEQYSEEMEKLESRANEDIENLLAGKENIDHEAAIMQTKELAKNLNERCQRGLEVERNATEDVKNEIENKRLDSDSRMDKVRGELNDVISKH